MPGDDQSARRVGRMSDRFDRDGAFSIELDADKYDVRNLSMKMRHLHKEFSVAMDH